MSGAKLEGGREIEKDKNLHEDEIESPKGKQNKMPEQVKPDENLRRFAERRGKFPCSYQ